MKGKASAPDSKNNIKFILLQYNSTLAPSKLTTIAKIKAKLEEFEEEKGKTWIELVEEEILKALQEIEAEAQPNEAASDWQGLHLDDVLMGKMRHRWRLMRCPKGSITP